MNGQLARKMRKYSKKFSEKAWREFYDVIYQWAILTKGK
jgi:hypothetical protein